MFYHIKLDIFGYDRYSCVKNLGHILTVVNIQHAKF